MGRAARLSGLIPPGSLLRERSFGLFWGAHAISETGSRITSVVAPILVYQLTGSALGPCGLCVIGPGNHDLENGAIDVSGANVVFLPTLILLPPTCATKRSVIVSQTSFSRA